MPRTVHVIGAGLAGLSAAVELQRRGRRIVLHDAHAHAGGRCRSWFDSTLGTTVDSGL
ncbi:FAD-dependent oxidoreductase, partial [Burkholderia multivorans]